MMRIIAVFAAIDVQKERVVFEEAVNALLVKSIVQVNALMFVLMLKIAEVVGFNVPKIKFATKADVFSIAAKGKLQRAVVEAVSIFKRMLFIVENAAINAKQRRSASKENVHVLRGKFTVGRVVSIL